VPFGKIGEKFRKKEKSVLFACPVCSFHRPLFLSCCAASRHVLASSCDLYFGSGLNNPNLHSLIANPCCHIMRSLISNPCCHIVCLPIAPHILLSAQVHLATVTHAQQQIASPCLVSSKLSKKFRNIKKKIVKVFARFSENVLFCRPHPTSVVGANFCGCIFFILVQKKLYKKIVKK
jgi:hypothetical protein